MFQIELKTSILASSPYIDRYDEFPYVLRKEDKFFILLFIKYNAKIIKNIFIFNFHIYNNNNF